MTASTPADSPSDESTPAAGSSMRGRPGGGEHVLISVAWPYANGPLHIGHVAGCYLPPDIQARFERARGNKVLMVSGSDEHGTPITVTAEQDGISPREVVDANHAINTQALLDLGCSWLPNVAPGGLADGGALFNRTSDPRHQSRVQAHFTELLEAGFLQRQTMEQYYEAREDGSGRSLPGRFLPDRYVEGTCPNCGETDARGDQCDHCGTTYEARELKDPRSKMSPDAKVTIRPTDHFFYRLDLFQDALDLYATSHSLPEAPFRWKTNVRAMARDWLDMGLRPRAVTRDLDWGIPVPLKGEAWDGKCVYVWFEAVQGYLTCAQIWAEAQGEPDLWENWWLEGGNQRHLYFLGKDNIPFHTVIWQAILLGLNLARRGARAEGDKVVLDRTPVTAEGMLPRVGELRLADDVPANEYLMLSGGQFSKSRKHAIWLPSFLERYDADLLRYYLSISMPEVHDTNFDWPDLVEKVNAELVAAHGNFCHRVFSLTDRLRTTRPNGANPLTEFDDVQAHAETVAALEAAHRTITASLDHSRFKVALREVMQMATLGNQVIQQSAPWSVMEGEDMDPADRHLGLSGLAQGWRIARALAIWSQPFMPAQAQRLWEQLGESGPVDQAAWDSAIDWGAPLTAMPAGKPEPLFQKLDLEAILAQEQVLAARTPAAKDDPGHGVKGSKRQKRSKDSAQEATPMSDEMHEGIATIEFQQFMDVELRTAHILSVEDHPNADKLLVITLDDGTDRERSVCAGIKGHYTAEELVGRTIVVVANLAPRKLRGIPSEGMLLAAEDKEGNVRLVGFDAPMPAGMRIH